jgi:6,7-dimethyl-8-ribityllumazine synthase
MPRVLIVEARFYEEIADELARGAIQHLDAAGVEYDRVTVPGAFEVPAAIAFAHQGSLKGGVDYDGYIALGCVIRGETSHYDYVCGESARGLQDLAIRDNLAIGYGILTVENGDQAWARAGVESGKNKGKDAAEACLAMVSLRHQFALS